MKPDSTHELVLNTRAGAHARMHTLVHVLILSSPSLVFSSDGAMRDVKTQQMPPSTL